MGGQFNNTNMLGNGPNVSSFLHHSYNNGGPTSGSSQRDAGDESDPLSVIRNHGQQFSNSSDQQIESQNFQQNQQLIQHNHNHNQQQYQNIRGGLGQVKLEPQMTNYQSLRNLGSVKMEVQHNQSINNLPPVKLEPQNSDQSLFLQQQFLNSRQSTQAAQMNVLHQRRLLQLHQQQQLLKNIPQQRNQMQPQFQQQNLALRSQAKPVYEPGTCARRLTHYMYQQQHRREDNSIEFWRKFVAEYFAPNAKKKWCVSLYGNGRHTTGVFPQDAWHCEICQKKPGRGFEAKAEVLPRLFKIKYESGTLEELLYVDMPREYQNLSGQIVLDYTKAIQESVFEQMRVVRDGQLRIVFTADLKICSWEFCARHHEELIPRRLLIPQISQLGNAAQKYQASTNNNASSNQSVPDLQTNCNMFVASARQLAKALEVPLVNDLGYTKRYVRCLQISEVVNSMKDLIDYSRETSIGPMECLAKFPRMRTSTTSGFQSQPQEPVDQQNSNVNNNQLPLTSSNGTIAGLLHQNSKNTPQNGALSNICTQPSDADPQSSVQKILHEMMMMSSQLGGNGSSNGDMKIVNNNNNYNNNSGFIGNGIRHNSLSMNGRMVMSHQQQQEDNGVGSVNGFNNVGFDWKGSP